MNETKPWYRSRGVWGSVISLIAVGAGLLGFNAGSAEQETALNLIDRAIVLGDEIIALAGAALALWGRISATKQIV